METTRAPEFWSKEEMQVWRKARGHLAGRRESGTTSPHGRDPTAGRSAHLNSVDLVPEGLPWGAGWHVTNIAPTQGPSGAECRGLHTGHTHSRKMPWGVCAPLRAKVGSWGLRGGGRQEALTSRKEQLAMSKMMQPRDQMSDFWLKEKLRASGAIQDFWKGSVGRSEVGHV